MMYSSGFLLAVSRTLDAEGLLSDDRRDRGGRTKYGITARLAARYGFPDVDALTREDAIGIYHAEFWGGLALDRIEDVDVAAEVFDTAVNMGQHAAVEAAQQAAWFFGESIKIDGDLGRSPWPP